MTLKISYESFSIPYVFFIFTIQLREIRVLINLSHQFSGFGVWKKIFSNEFKSKRLTWKIKITIFSIAFTENLLRRRKDCWHTLKIGESTAVIDIIMITESVYMVLKKHFRHLPCYVNLLDLFRESTMISTIGQSMDFLLSRGDVSNFTMDTYQ